MKKLLLLLQVLAISIYSYSIDITNLKFERITSDNGLSQNVVEKIFQDSKGYIWIATRDGVNRYDGMEFHVFRNDRNDSNSLASNWVTAIAEDADGRLWFGTDGLNYYDPVQDKLFRVPLSDGSATMYQGGRVYDIIVDYDNTLWLATAHGLAHYFPDRNEFKTYIIDEASGVDLRYSNSLLLTSDNTLFIGSAEFDPLFEFDRAKDSFIEHPYKKDFFGNNYKKNITEGPDGRLYIGSEEGCLHIYDYHTGLSEILPLGGENGLHHNSIKTGVQVLSDDMVLIGTDGQGIHIYNPLDRTMKYMKNSETNDKSLSSNAVFDIFVDDHGNLWVGHYGTGLSVWKKHKEKFRSYLPNPADPNSINSGVILSVFQDSKERIWIGYDGSGLSLFNEEENTFTHYRYHGDLDGSLSTDVIVCIDEDPDGNLLLGTYGGGLMVFNPELGKVIEYLGEADGLPNPHVWDIQKDYKGNYWLAILGVGYSIYNPSDKSFETFYYGDERVHSNVIFGIKEFKPDEMWFGAEQQGAMSYDFALNKSTNYSAFDHADVKLSSSRIKDIVFQDDSLVWFATDGGGINRFNRNTKEVKVYTKEEGLAANAIMGILLDDHGNVWASSTAGLIKLKPSTGMVLNYDKSKGLQGNEFKYNAQFKLSDGRMIFGGPNGITIFHPDSVKTSIVQPKLVFTDLLIFNKSVDIGTEDSPLKNHINYTDRIKLRNKHRVFTIEFASLDYTNADKNTYEYKLEGFDEEWVVAGNRNFASYTNLPAGKYTFMVKGSNSDGAWSNSASRSIEIKVLPPWYRSIVFMLSVVVLLVLGIVKYIKKREESAKEEKLLLQRKIDEGQKVIDTKLKEIEQQQEEIRIRDINEKEIRFLNEGLAHFGQLISKSRNNLNELAQVIISELVKYVGADVGAIFIAEKDASNQNILKVRGQYCMDKNIQARDGILEGEGYVGTCFAKLETLSIDDLPDGYISLSSGLGEVVVRNDVFEPIEEEEVGLGVIEVASIKKLPKYKVDFIKKIAQTIASVFALEKANDQTKQLLEENERKTEEIMTHEEELRIHIEELQASQEASSRREEDLIKELEQKSQTIIELKDKLGEK